MINEDGLEIIENVEDFSEEALMELSDGAGDEE